MKAFGSRAGDTCHGGPSRPDSDLDIYVTLRSEVANSRAKLEETMDRIEDIADLFGRVKGLPINPVIELDTLAPAHKLQLHNTPFVPLSN